MENIWEYNRHFFESENILDMFKELNELGALGWEIIHYEENKPEKFGGKFRCIIIVKRLKPA